MGVDLGVYTMIRKRLLKFFRLSPSHLGLHRLGLFFLPAHILLMSILTLHHVFKIP